MTLVSADWHGGSGPRPLERCGWTRISSIYSMDSDGIAAAGRTRRDPGMCKDPPRRRGLRTTG